MKKKSAFHHEKIPKKTKNELEKEKREEGLQKSLDSSNKGFSLLAKMGYKPGESLGKAKTGRIEPIPIEIKNDRGGLGREAVKREIKETKAKLRLQKLNSVTKSTISAEDFRASQSKKLREKRTEGDLFRSQKACRQLDMSKDFSEPVESWFWPKIFNEDDPETEPKIKEIVNEEEEDNEEVEDEIEIPPEEMLRIITEYLRSQYLFCVWCGITFENPDDLKTSCPGNSREDHDD